MPRCVRNPNLMPPSSMFCFPDTRRLPSNFADLLVRLFDDAGFGEELQERLQQQPAVQRRLAGLAARALRGPVPPDAASEPDSREQGQRWTDSIWDATSLLSLPALDAARRQLAPTMLPTAAGLAAQLVTDLLPPPALAGSNAGAARPATGGCGAASQVGMQHATAGLAVDPCNWTAARMLISTAGREQDLRDCLTDT